MEKINKLFSNTEKDNNTLEQEIGLPCGSITNWRTGKSQPSAEEQRKIAAYFNIPSDNLTRNTKPSSKMFPYNLQEIHEMWQTFDGTDKMLIHTYIKTIYNKNLKQKKTKKP